MDWLFKDNKIEACSTYQKSEKLKKKKFRRDTWRGETFRNT
jgi:hypothetical protein